jgi:hypothetical protein
MDYQSGTELPHSKGYANLIYAHASHTSPHCDNAACNIALV